MSASHPITTELVRHKKPALRAKSRNSVEWTLLPLTDTAHSNDFGVFFATSIKARSFGAKEARRG
jgi:hypothetical protein